MAQSGKKQKAGSSNFGPKGWFIVIISIVYFYLSTAVTSDGLNVINDYLSNHFQVGMSNLTIFATVGGWLTLVSIPLFTALAQKKGAKVTIITSLPGYAAFGYLIVSLSLIVSFCIDCVDCVFFTRLWIN